MLIKNQFGENEIVFFCTNIFSCNYKKLTTLTFDSLVVKYMMKESNSFCFLSSFVDSLFVTLFPSVCQGFLSNINIYSHNYETFLLFQ